MTCDTAVQGTDLYHTTTEICSVGLYNSSKLVSSEGRPAEHKVGILLQTLLCELRDAQVLRHGAMALQDSQEWRVQKPEGYA